MKKFILGAMAFIAVIMIVGSIWNMNHNKEYAFDAYQEKVASRDKKIKELKDSLNEMRILYLNSMISIDSLEMEIRNMKHIHE